METIKLSKQGKKFWSALTKKTKVFVEVTDKPVALNGAYWDGGSRDYYYHVNKNGNITPLTAPGCPAYDPRPVPLMPIPEDGAIVTGGFFCGNPATLHIKVRSKEGWVF